MTDWPGWTRHFWFTLIGDTKLTAFPPRFRDRCRTVAVACLVVVAGLAAACSSATSATSTSRGTNTTNAQHPAPSTTLPPATWSLIPADTLGQKSPGSIAVWTGSEVLVDHNGCCAGAGDVQLDAYVPATGTWKATAATPLWPRNDPGMVWTGHEVIAFGGSGSATGSPPVHPLTDGAAYDPATNQWHAIAAMPEPFIATRGGGAVWTGSQVLAWSFDPTGHETFLSYNPTSNTWKVLPPSGMPAPETTSGVASGGAGVVWAGSELLVWRSNTSGSAAPMSDGAAYDPATNRWTALPAPPTPLGVGAAAAWTGTDLVVWGGVSGTTPLATGAMYDPSTNRWSATARSVLPPTTDAAAVWTGSTVFVAGGLLNVPSASAVANLSGAVATFDPASNTWAAVAPAPALAAHLPPSGTAVATARDMPDLVWTGSQVIMVSGYDGAYQAPRPDGVAWTP